MEVEVLGTGNTIVVEVLEEVEPLVLEVELLDVVTVVDVVELED